MRKFVAPVLVALLAAAPGAAFAASTMAPKPAAPMASTSIGQAATGTVKAFDLKAQTLTLADGKTYKLPANFRDPGLKVGEKVTVHWKMNGKAYDATSVTIG